MRGMTDLPLPAGGDLRDGPRTGSRDRYWIGLIESYKARYPKVADLIRRGYSAERVAELAGCEVWVPKMIKYSGRF